MKILIVLFLGTALAYPTNIGIEKFAASSRQFTAAIYDLLENEDNFLVSPFSVESVVALMQSGAIGTTGEEIRAALYLPETKEGTEALIKSILPSFKDDKYILHTANKIYVENNYQINDDFKKVTTDVYQAEFQNIEFSEPNAVDEINEWVEEETNDKIKDLLQHGDVDESTRVVLINALYFQGNWSLPFDLTYTKKAAFYAPASNKIQPETMHQQAQLYSYYESPELNAKFLELPFVGQNASMTIILPNEKQGLSLLEKEMKSVLITPKYTKEYVQVSLPKFKIESKIDFGRVLQQLGIKAAFDPTQADFSGIAGVPGELVLSKITQKTYIDVNEGGVEAAAATAATIGTTSVVDPPVATKTFVADHPFAFYIKVNDIILFGGRVVEPKY